MPHRQKSTQQIAIVMNSRARKASYCLHKTKELKAEN